MATANRSPATRAGRGHWRVGAESQAARLARLRSLKSNGRLNALARRTIVMRAGASHVAARPHPPQSNLGCASQPALQGMNEARHGIVQKKKAAGSSRSLRPSFKKSRNR
jgi:hypothetical protein